MKKINLAKLVAAIAIASFVFAMVGCNSTGGSSKYTPGTYTSTATGFHGDVNVAMTFSQSKITDVKIDANETQGIGSRAVEMLPEVILKAQSADVDSISGATVSSNAIKMAAANCIEQAMSGKGASASVKMAPGKYTAYAESFRARNGLNVTVEVSDTKILSIDVDTVNTADTPPVLRSAINAMVPRIIENQSLSVDTITGATASSNGIRAATTLAVQKAIVAAGGKESDISAFYKPIAKVGGTKTINTDVLVIGMGGSGMNAALSAAESGLKVLAIDKAARFGGTSGLSSEGLFVNPPRYQKEHNGGKDYTDADVMLKAWLTYTEGDAKEDIVRRMIYESGKVLDWMYYDVGVTFGAPATGFTPSDVYVTKYQWSPVANKALTYNAAKDELSKLFEKAWNKFTALGNSYMLETEGYELIYDKATNKVTGAKARNTPTGTEYIINAKAVVLATGGFAGNPAMETKLLQNTYYPLKGEWKQFGSFQDDGKMFQAALDIGAATYNISVPPEVHNSGTVSFISMQFEPHYLPGEIGGATSRPAFWTEGDLPANLGWSADSLAVDVNGNRFTSETGVSFLDPWIAGPRFFSIWSQEQIDKIAREGFSFPRTGRSNLYLGAGTPIPVGVPVPNVPAVLEAAQKADIMVKGNTLEELASKLGMKNLVSTVAAYNRYCDSGNDTQFKKPAQYLNKIGNGPYYAVRMASYCYGTVGGLDINAKFEVLNTSGKSIDGLYAVGTDSMGVLFTEKKPYVTYGGANNGWGSVSGYLAGKEIAAKYK